MRFFGFPVGRDKYYEHVKSYELAFSKDGQRWNRYKENGRIRVSCWYSLIYLDLDWAGLKLLELVSVLFITDHLPELLFVSFKFSSQVLPGNCDNFTPVVNRLIRPIQARFVRFYPRTYNNICMRVEVYGCSRHKGKVHIEMLAISDTT